MRSFVKEVMFVKYIFFKSDFIFGHIWHLPMFWTWKLVLVGLAPTVNIVIIGSIQENIDFEIVQALLI